MQPNRVPNWELCFDRSTQTLETEAGVIHQSEGVPLTRYWGVFGSWVQRDMGPGLLLSSLFSAWPAHGTVPGPGSCPVTWTRGPGPWAQNFGLFSKVLGNVFPRIHKV